MVSKMINTREFNGHTHVFVVSKVINNHKDVSRVFISHTHVFVVSKVINSQRCFQGIHWPKTCIYGFQGEQQPLKCSQGYQRSHECMVSISMETDNPNNIKFFTILKNNEMLKACNVSNVGIYKYVEHL